ncbi:MAG: respiratory nitrate reductase subunit gamma [Acidobacteriota bacterium]|jgi:nitrate reductase gamma subunit
MAGVLYVCFYACGLVFVVACVVKAVSYAKLPIHLRWELYPVPHEEPDRVRHGGSYFEESDWWTKSVRFNFLGELKYMAAEIAFLKALWEFKRSLWYRSYAFHLGLYLIISTAALVLLAALLGLFAPGILAGAAGLYLHWIYTVTGSAGVILSFLGAAALLQRRLTDPELKNYTTPGDLFNLLFFMLVLLLLAAGYALRPAGAPGVVAMAQGMLTFDLSLRIPGLLFTGLLLGAILTAYIPFTHMSHFIAKYFTYHSIRWNDEPNVRGGKMEAKLAEYLTYRPRWAASHIRGDGVKTWADVATTNPAQEPQP